MYEYYVSIYNNNNLSSQLLKEDIPCHFTSNSKKVDVALYRLNKSSNSHNGIGVGMFNKLPLKIITLPLDVFKRNLYSMSINNPFYSVS